MSRVTGSPAGSVSVPVVKYFPHFENWPFAGGLGGLSRLGGDGRQLCPMDRIKPTLWKMSPFGPRPTSHAQPNQPTHGTNCKNILGKISVYGINRIKSTLCKIWTGIKSYAVTNPAHTSCGFAKKNISKQEISDVRVGLKNNDVQ